MTVVKRLAVALGSLLALRWLAAPAALLKFKHTKCRVSCSGRLVRPDQLSASFTHLKRQSRDDAGTVPGDDSTWRILSNQLASPSCGESKV
jgi:hypothetical protein